MQYNCWKEPTIIAVHVPDPAPYKLSLHAAVQPCQLYSQKALYAWKSMHVLPPYIFLMERLTCPRAYLWLTHHTNDFDNIIMLLASIWILASACLPAHTAITNYAPLQWHRAKVINSLPCCDYVPDAGGLL